MKNILSILVVCVYWTLIVLMLYFKNLPVLFGVWVISTGLLVSFVSVKIYTMSENIDSLVQDYFNKKNLNVDEMIEFYKAVSGK
jgi:hypothetical protein